MSFDYLVQNLNLRDPKPLETIRIMAMSLGELATNAEDNSRAVEKAVGNLTLCCLYFCELHNLDLMDAAYKAADVERPRIAPPRAGSNSSSKNGPFFKAASDARAYSQQQHQQSSEPDLVSPNTTSQFFLKLDDLAEKPRTVVDETPLYWVVVLEDGTIREAFDGGRSVRVERERFNEYYQWAQQFRHGYEPPARVINVTAPINTDDKHERMLYSPNHFDNDIFSPHNPHDSLLVIRDRAGSNGNEDAATNPASSRSRVNSHSPAPQVYQDASSERSPAEIVFWDKVEKLESQKLSPKEVADLKLTWQFPHNSKLVQLTQNGNLVAVTEKNKRDFLEKLRQKLSELEGGSMNGSGGDAPRRKSIQGALPFGRTASEKKLSVSNPQNPEGVQELFSPTHDDAGLFAPSADADAHSTIRIDTGAPSQSTLPRALQDNSSPKGSSNGSSTVNPTAAFSQKITEGDFFINAISAIYENPSAADKFGITWCMPIPIDNPTTIRDLVQNGRSVRVSPADVPRYLALIRDNM